MSQSHGDDAILREGRGGDTCCNQPHAQDQLPGGSNRQLRAEAVDDALFPLKRHCHQGKDRGGDAKYWTTIDDAAHKFTYNQLQINDEIYS